MLEERPLPKDWEDVYFSDECHFGFGPEGKIWIIRKDGTRFDCENLCLQGPEPDEADKKRHHVWGAAVGFHSISALTFYDSGNSKGKMNLQTYRSDILEPVVGQWIKEGRKFVLEEDGDSVHGYGSDHNIVATWKAKHGLSHYKNVRYSPDLAPIENCWAAPKSYSRKQPRRDDETTKDLIVEGWDRHSYKGVNSLIHSMPKRLKDVLRLKGQYTSY